MYGTRGEAPSAGISDHKVRSQVPHHRVAAPRTGAYSGATSRDLPAPVQTQRSSAAARKGAPTGTRRCCFARWLLRKVAGSRRFGGSASVVGRARRWRERAGRPSGRRERRGVPVEL